MVETGFTFDFFFSFPAKDRCALEWNARGKLRRLGNLALLIILNRKVIVKNSDGHFSQIGRWYKELF